MIAVATTQPDGLTAMAFLTGILLWVSWVTRNAQRKHEIDSTLEQVELRGRKSSKLLARVPRRRLELVESRWQTAYSSGPALELRFGQKASLVIGLRAATRAALLPDGTPLEPSIFVSRRTWYALRRALEDFLV